MEISDGIEKELEFIDFLLNVKKRTKKGINSVISSLNAIQKKTSYQITLQNILDTEKYSEILQVLELLHQEGLNSNTFSNYKSYLNNYLEYARFKIVKKDNLEYGDLAVRWISFIESLESMKQVIGFGTSNIVGDFAELLCINYYGGTKLRNSKKSADFEIKSMRFQVKARILRDNNQATQLGVIRSIDFDFLVVVLFGTDGCLHDVREIPKKELSFDIKTRSSYQNGFIISTTKSYFNLGKSLLKEFSEMFKLPICKNIEL